MTTHANEHGSGDTFVAQVPRCQGCATFTVRSKRCHELAVDFALKDSSPLVIIGYHDPHIGGGFRTEALLLGRGERSLHLTQVAQNRYKFAQGDVKNALLQGTGTGSRRGVGGFPSVRTDRSPSHLHRSSGGVDFFFATD